MADGLLGIVYGLFTTQQRMIRHTNTAKLILEELSYGCRGGRPPWEEPPCMYSEDSIRLHEKGQFVSLFYLRQ